MDVISLKNIEKVYGEKDYRVEALKSINLKVKKGELLAIIGPSGSGKSTLLNILGFMDKQTAGDYEFEEKSTEKLSNKELAKLRNEKIGFVFQNFNLLYDFNLIENVALPLTYSKNKKNIKERAKISLEKVGLKEYGGRTPDKISGGQKQRVAIARALINNPEIILADEPTGALDNETGLEVMKILKDINKEGKTVIIITHNNEIADMCNRKIMIIDGKLIEN